MKTKIEATIGGVNLNVKMFKFSGGEYQVSIRTLTSPPPHKTVYIVAHMLDGDIMPLALTVDAIRRQYNPSEIILSMPYLPYARQDRVMNPGESLALKVFADALNSLELNQVIIADCHSDVGVALVKNCTNRSATNVLGGDFSRVINKPDALVAPDAGALKKTFQYAKDMGVSEVIRADKIRDVSTGQITGTAVFGDVAGKSVLIMDDICDGGRTFIELAKVLREKGASNIHLHVTHGIFSQGQEVFDGLIDRVTATFDYEEMFK